MVKVSVLTPLYNTKIIHLQEMIDSVLRQSFKDFEFLLLNDSPDNGEIKRLIETYKDERIKYYENEKNLGISASRNKLINLAKGEYLAVCDHDDISMPLRFEKQVKYLDEYKDVGVVSGLCEVFGGGNHIFQEHPQDDVDIKIHLTKGCYVAHPASMIRKSVLLDHHIFYNEKYSPAEDYKMWADLMDVTNFYNIQDVLLKYRSFEKNTSVLQKKRMSNISRLIQLEIRNKHSAFFEAVNVECKNIYWINFLGFLPFLKIKKRKILLFGFFPLFSLKEISE